MYLQGNVWRKSAQKIIAFLNRLPDLDSKKLVVAFSGGMDSLFLLLALVDLQRKYGYEILPVHINHRLLPEDNLYADLANLATLKLKIPCLIVESTLPVGKNNLEKKMRDERYRLLRKIKKDHSADYIVVAHHANDQTETIFANLIRGCGVNGLRGMRGINGDIIRPLLKISKDDIRQAVLATKFSYYEDRLNYDTQGRRNKIRRDLIPFIERRTGADLTEVFLTLGENMTDLASFIAEEKNKIRKSIGLTGDRNIGYSFSRIKFTGLTVFWRREIIRDIFSSISGRIPSQKDILKIDFWLEKGQLSELGFKNTLWKRSRDKKITVFGLSHS